MSKFNNKIGSRHDLDIHVAEILLKLALNINQSLDHKIDLHRPKMLQNTCLKLPT